MGWIDNGMDRQWGGLAMGWPDNGMAIPYYQHWTLQIRTIQSIQRSTHFQDHAGEALITHQISNITEWKQDEEHLPGHTQSTHPL